MSTITQQFHITKLQATILVILAALGFTAAAAFVMLTMPFKMALAFVVMIAGGTTFLLLRDRRRVVLAALVFVIPLNIDVNLIEKSSPGGADGLSFGLVEIALLLLLLITLLRSLNSKQTQPLQTFPALLLPSLAMLFFFMLSTINAVDLIWSAFDIVNFIKVILVFWLVANNVISNTDIQIVLLALFASVLVQSGIATAVNVNPAMNDLFLTFKLGVAGELTGEVIRSGGSLGNANHLGRYLGLILPIAYIMLLTRQNRTLTIAAALTAIVGTLALINTLSRSAWIGLALSVLIMLPLMLRYRHISFRTLWLFGLAALFAVVLMIFFGETIWLRLTQDDHGSTMTRITTAKVAWAIIKDYPFFGCGINNYGAMLPAYWIGEDTFTNKAAVHNNYLLYMAEIGIIGFTAVLWWLVAFGARIAKAMRSANRFYSALAISFAGGYAGMLLESLSDKSYKENFSLLLILWTLMAITEAIIRIGDQHDHRAITA
jgi:O-antigen ligase